MRRTVLIGMLMLAACNQPATNPAVPDGDGVICPEHRNGTRYTAEFIDPGKTYIARSGNYWFRTNADFPAGTKVTLKLENLPSVGTINYDVYYSSDANAFISGFFQAKDPGGIPSNASVSDVADTSGAYFIELEHLDYEVQRNGCATFQVTLLAQ